MKIKTKLKTKKNTIIILLTISIQWLFAHASYAVVNSDPGDYTALPPGTQLNILYYQHVSADKVYSKDQEVVDNLGLTMDIGVYRYVKFIKLGSWIADPQIVIPFAHQQDDLTEESYTGVGDAMVGAAFWPLHDMENNHHFGFGVYLNTPTGAHKNEGFAISSNRFGLNLQLGYIRQITEKLKIDLVTQNEFFTNQRDTDVKKDNFYQVDISGRYTITDNSYFGLSYRTAWGGQESLDGTTLLNSEERDTGILTWATFLLPNLQSQIQYRQDIDVKDGVSLSGLQTRFLYIF